MHACAKWTLLVWALTIGAARAQPIADADIRAAMSRVEMILVHMGVDVAGYGLGPAPAVELAPAGHVYLQGNDGAYVGGRIYVSDRAIADCRELTLVHELVHDATVKRRLFASVANAELRPAMEALADTVTAIAADDPYRPGCLPVRSVAHSKSELVSLANAAP